jgi:hypothetical protein
MIGKKILVARQACLGLLHRYADRETPQHLHKHHRVDIYATPNPQVRFLDSKYSLPTLFSGPQVSICIGSASHEYKLSKTLLCNTSWRPSSHGFNRGSLMDLQALQSTCLESLLTIPTHIYCLSRQSTPLQKETWTAVSPAYPICEHSGAEEKVGNGVTLCNARSLTRAPISRLEEFRHASTIE